MLEGYKRIGIYNICLLIALVAWCIGIAGAQRIQTYSHMVELRYDEEKLSSKQVQSVLKEEDKSDERLISSLVAWGQTQDVVAENEVLGKSTQVDLLQLYGEANILLPINKLVGDSLVIGDTKGCIISQKVAYDLWGSLDVIGKPLKYKEKEYIVRGVLEEDASLMMIQVPKSDKETMFTGLRLKFLENENMKEEVRQLKGRYGLPEGVMINLSLQAIICIQVMLLPGWLIGLITLYKLYKIVYKKRHKWAECIMWMVSAIVSTFIVLRIVQLNVDIPIYFIPNKWSDFEFWVRTWKEVNTESLAVSGLPTLIPDLWRLNMLNLLKGASVVSGIAFVMAGRNLEVKNINDLFWHILLAIVMTFVAILITYYLGFELLIIQALWLTWVCYILVHFINKKLA